MPPGSTNGRGFTEAARDAAAVARQRKREHRERFPDDHALAMLVVRVAGAPPGFGWQIRRFGRMSPLAQSREVFRDPAEAERAGRAALDRMKLAPWDRGGPAPDRG